MSLKEDCIFVRNNTCLHPAKKLRWCSICRDYWKDIERLDELMKYYVFASSKRNSENAMLVSLIALLVSFVALIMSDNFAKISEHIFGG